MKITEKKLLDGYATLTEGGHIVSILCGVKYYWNYREDHTSRTDGYSPVCSQQNADAIYLDQTQHGGREAIEINRDIENLSLKKIEEAEQKLYSI